MSIEQLIADHMTALNRNSNLLERVIAGQEAAMAKLEGGAKTTRSRKAKEEPAAEPQGESSDSAVAPAATEPEAPVAEAASEPTGVAAIVAGIKTADDMQAYVQGWTGATEDADERKRRVDLLKATAADCGVAPKFSEILPHAEKFVTVIEGDKATPAAASASDFG